MSHFYIVLTQTAPHMSRNNASLLSPQALKVPIPILPAITDLLLTTQPDWTSPDWTRLWNSTFSTHRSYNSAQTRYLTFCTQCNNVYTTTTVTRNSPMPFRVILGKRQPGTHHNKMLLLGPTPITISS